MVSLMERGAWGAQNHWKCIEFTTFFIMCLVEWGVWGVQTHAKLSSGCCLIFWWKNLIYYYKTLCFWHSRQFTIVKTMNFEHRVSKRLCFTVTNWPMFSKTLFFTMETACTALKIWSTKKTIFLKLKNCGRAIRNKTPTTRSAVRVVKTRFAPIGG